MQYLISKDIPLTEIELNKIIKSFLTSDKPKLEKRYNYYIGKQDILRRVPSDDGKPCNKVVCNFVKNIVDTYEGYALGIPVTYEGEDSLTDVLNYNDIVDEDAELFRNGLIFGTAVEICYVDEDGKQRFKVLDPREVIPVYENNLNGDLLYAIRIWEEALSNGITPDYYCQVYDDTTVKTYKSSSGYTSFTLINEEVHHFTQVPFVFFKPNSEEQGIAESIFSLQDAYNSLVSDSLDDWDSFCDAYLVLKGTVADEEDLRSMKEHRVLMLDSDSEADYLIKNTSTTEIEHLLKTVEEKIRELSACPNFNNETFGTSSGIAIKYRIMAMENNTASMLANFKKALQRRIELLSDIMNIVYGESFWRDIQIEFTRNLPTDLTDTVTAVNQLRGLVSDETLLSLLPFIQDVSDEMERIKQQNEDNMSMYQFGVVDE